MNQTEDNLLTVIKGLVWGRVDNYDMVADEILEALKETDLFVHNGKILSIVEVDMRDCGPDYDAYLVYTDYEPEDEEE